jgi:hypothetical protein
MPIPCCNVGPPLIDETFVEVDQTLHHGRTCPERPQRMIGSGDGRSENGIYLITKKLKD